jgi:methionyl-tRNA formyltransferase
VNVLVCGTRFFGHSVVLALSKLPRVTVKWVSCPPSDRCEWAAEQVGAEVIRGCKEADVPEGVDLIVAAHSHDFISEKARLRSKLGGIGYHPSLLPLHRGKDAVEWAIRMGDKVTGGTVYRLSNKVDGGNILAQRHVFIRPDDTAKTLWRRDLCPLGIEMLSSAVSAAEAEGYRDGLKQSEELASWEPSIGRPPLFRPDLLMLEEVSSCTLR